MKLNISLLALLCLFFQARAQNASILDIPLKIGDNVPDITINNIINYKGQNGKPATTAKISDFKGKLLILDFWATWCSPCVAMIPKMDSLQKAFNGKVQFLPVSYQTEEIVQTFLDKLQSRRDRRYDLPDATNDTKLNKLFPHTYLPHYVWIDQTGIVKAITEYNAINYENINAAVNRSSLAVKEKKDAKALLYDKEKPLFIAGNGGDGNTLLFHSVISSYTTGLFTGYSYREDTLKGVRISCRNMPIIELYRMAFGDKDYFSKKRTLLLVNDTNEVVSHLSGTSYTEWLSRNHAFCYELIVPYNKKSSAHAIMYEDLRRFFPQYDIQLEKRKVTCLVLIRTSKNDKIHSKGGQSVSAFSPDGFTLQNFSLDRFFGQLNFVSLQNYPLPIVDGTDYKGLVDLQINGNLSDVTAINMELEKYDLQFVTAEREVDMMVVKDNLQESSKN